MKREQVLPHVMADMAARIAKGADEYGEPLTTFNGRDALLDAYEEALDLAMYLKQAIMERPAESIFEYTRISPNEPLGDGPRVSMSIDLTKTATVLTQPPSDPWPGPDWTQAPEWAMWWAVDGCNGQANWYYFEPKKWHGLASWQFGGGKSIPPPFALETCKAPLFGYTGDWRDSLRKRPK